MYRVCVLQCGDTHPPGADCPHGTGERDPAAGMLRQGARDGGRSRRVPCSGQSQVGDMDRIAQ